MTGSILRFMCRAAILVAVLAISGCGEPEVAEPATKQLKMLDFYPQTNETVAANDLVVVVVFSETVTFGTGSTDVNEDTFYLEDDTGAKIEDCTVEASEPDPQKATALLLLPEPTPLVPGETYWMVIKGTIQGKEADGDATKPLGDDIRSHFIIQ